MNWNADFYAIAPKEQHGLVLFRRPTSEASEGCPPVGAIVVPEDGSRLLVSYARPSRLLLFATWLDTLPEGTELGWSSGQTLGLPRNLASLVVDYGVQPTVGLAGLHLGGPPPGAPARELEWVPPAAPEELRWFPVMSQCLRCGHPEHSNNCSYCVCVR